MLYNMSILKEIVKSSQVISDFTAFCYNILHANLILRKGVSCKGAFLNNTRIIISGKGNTITLGRLSRLYNCKITIHGNNCKVVIGGGSTIIRNTEFCLEDDNNYIFIGKDFTMEGGHIASTEGERITIGNDCMFSSDVEIRNGDSHVIIDVKTGKRTNWSSCITIGDHVWLAAHVRVLKGSSIPSHTVIGSSSIVSGKLSDENAVYAGIPAKLIKEKTDWDRFRKNYRK